MQRSHRSRTSVIAFGWFGVAAAGIGSLPPEIHAQTARTAIDAVYSAAQAMRGRALYQQRCATCHGEPLAGSLAPPLAGTIFMGAWGGRSLWELAGKIRNTMPADEPGKLTLSQTADLVAYLLQIGKFPSGEADLASDEAGLKSVSLPASGQQPSRPASSQGAAVPATGNMQQLMAAILFPRDRKSTRLNSSHRL